MSKARKLSFLGAGKLGGALLRGLQAEGGHWTFEACTQRPETARALAGELGILVHNEVRKLAQDAEILVLGVKPAPALPMLESLASAFKPGTLGISLCAGLPLDLLAKSSGPQVRWVRAMCNVASQVGHGVSYLCSSSAIGLEDRALVRRIFAAIGQVEEGPELDMDIVTALSASGPAFVMAFARAWQEAGVDQGLDPQLALRLALGCFEGTAVLLRTTGGSPEDWIRKVATPGGVTEAGLNFFKEKELESLVRQGLKKTAARSAEIGSLIRDPLKTS